jgi:transcriptional/translational regulatory protein YebC/TACO1
MKNVLDKHEAKLGGPGSVSYMKAIVPLPSIELTEPDREKIESLLNLLDGLDDVVETWSNLA